MSNMMQGMFGGMMQGMGGGMNPMAGGMRPMAGGMNPMGRPQMGQMGANPAMGGGMNPMAGAQGQMGPQGMQQQGMQKMGQMLDQVMKAVGQMAQMLQQVMGNGKGPQQFPGAQPAAQQPKANACAGKFAGGGAVVQEGEMVSALEAGVTELNVNMHNEKNANGETLMRSSATINDKKVMTEDVWFAKK